MSEPYANNVTLLLHGNGADGSTTFTDASLAPSTLTAYGDAKISTAQSKFGGSSMYFDGTGDYVTAPGAAAFDFGTGDFTIEMWFRSTQADDSATLLNREWVAAPWTAGVSIQLHHGLGGPLRIWWSDWSSGGPFLVGTTTTHCDGTWHHLAWTRNGSTHRLFLDGVIEATATTTTAFGSAAARLALGTDLTFGPRNYLGYLDEVRITKGVARYTADFAPPAAEFSDPVAMSDPYFSNVSLLLSADGADASTLFVDSGPMRNTLTAYGNAKISTAHSKFGGSSMYFDGAGDYAMSPYDAGFALGTGDLTIEMWTYRTVASGLSILIDFRGASGGVGAFPTLYVAGDNNLHLYMSGSDVWVGTTPITLNAWTHVALSRVSGVLRVFVDGVVAGATPASTNDWVCGTNGIVVGAEGPNLGTNTYAGYIDDLRVTKGVGRYTAAFTPPNVAFGAPLVLGGVALLTAPMPTLSASGGPRSTANLDAPVATLAGWAGGNAGVATAAATTSAYSGGQSRLSVTATATSFGGGRLVLTSASATVAATGRPSATAFLALAKPTLETSGHNSAGENDFTFTLGAPSLSAYSGANAKLSTSSAALSVTGTFVNFGAAEIVTPAAMTAASGTVSGMGQAALTLTDTFSLVGYSGAVCSVTLTGKATVLARGTTGSVGQAALILPLYDLTASGTAQNHGGASLLMPAARLGATAQAWLVSPGATLTAVGSAVVVATYEAYAVNLNHNDPAANDEVTRYTNFPFTQIVRYQGSYFGVAADGLYLLEGTTDDGEVIPWAFKTAMTDFKNPFRKTVVSAYFGGRLGPAATIDLHVGEDGPTTYSYATVRSDHAQCYRQKFGRGLTAHYYALGAAGVGTLEIDNIEFNTMNSTRRI